MDLLSDYNYILWKNRMMFKLKRKKLWSFVSNKNVTGNDDKDQMDSALGLIGEFCSDNYINIISKHDSPYGVRTTF